ncbi:tetratricopeptide repeat protein [Hartmannibacter diazotrophicus]|nr:tetratricopeptide repeat protein [Hartmannibacter diazotrophicus]
MARTLVLMSGVFLAGAVPALAERPAEALNLPSANSTSGNFLAAFHADRIKDLDASATYFTRALQTAPHDPYLLERAFALTLADGEIKDALSIGKQLMKANPDNRMTYLAFGIDALKHGKWSKAVELTSQSKADPLSDLVAEVISAWAELGSGKAAAALARLDKLKGPPWYDLFRSYHAGLIADAAGKPDEAVKRLRVAYGYDQGSIRITEAYVRALVRDGQIDEARQLVDGLLTRIPDHVVLSRLRADIAGKQSMKPFVTDPNVGAAEILAGLGNAIARDDDGTDLVAGFLQLALYLDPKTEVARLTLAEIFERAQNYERAIEVLSEIDDTSSFKRAAEIQIGFDYNSLDKVDEARAHLETVLKKNPEDLEAAIALGNILRVRKMFKESSEVYTQAIDHMASPAAKDWSIYYYRGITLERTDRWPEAEADFKKALELSPDQPLVLNYLGYSWVDRGENYDQALDMIKKAVDAEPTDGYIVDSLGWVYYKLGRYQDAVTQLEQAVNLRPGDPTINDHLGDAYWRVGRRIEARFQWAHARDSNPETADLPKILEKLVNGLPDATSKQAADGDKPSGG